MGGGSSANDLVRWIRTLHEAGAIGGLSDARLVERFANLNGTDRDDAFSALVYRHGPMVQRVCRRMLSDPADAADAFQAVFLVLARKAGSLRRAEDLKSWLYGVAVRTSLEARKRRARLRAREGAPLDDARAAITRDESFEPRALLDEELNKLPNRLREPLLLCELEGVSRQEAARRLGLPEGTLSSRLARGRSLLRDRLTRRGVAVAALGAMFPAPAKAAAPVDASLRLALKFAARDAGAGTVPAAVASLAEGVLLMFQATKLKTALLATSTLIAACLTAGLVAGRASPPAEGPQKVAAQTAEPAKKDKPREPLQSRGVVVDEAGNPVAGAEVLLDAFRVGETRGVTDQNGAFAILAPEGNLDGRSILARAGDGRGLGFSHYEYDLTRAEAETPVRIEVKPSREITVHVADADKAPIEDAVVEAVGDYYAVAHAKTGADGTAKLSVPIDFKVSFIVAKKEGAGFDYAEFGKFSEWGAELEGAAVGELPDSVALAIDARSVARIKAVDQDGKPLAGVDFRVWLLQREGRRGAVDYFSRMHVATTDADGVATYDWLPPLKAGYLFFPVGDRFPQRRVVVKENQAEPIVTSLDRTEAIRGRVVLPDGSPAPDIKVTAFGAGHGQDDGQARARTDKDGKYELRVGPNEAYAVGVDDKNWAARSRLDIVVRPGQPIDGLDFQLVNGTLIKGTLTVGPDNRPAAGELVAVAETGGLPPDDLREKGGQVSREVRRYQGVNTDAQGRYEIRVAPGTYTVSGPPRTGSKTITITNQPEVVHDFHMPRTQLRPLFGRVVAALDEKPVAGARVQILVENQYGLRRTVKADDEGRFRVERDPDKTFVWGLSPDGSLGGVVEIGADDPEVVLTLTPTATATGLLLDEQGKTAANQQIEWGRRVQLNKEPRASTLAFTSADAATDDQGRFTLPALVVGQKYEITAQKGNGNPIVGFAEPQKPGPLDLGTLQIGANKGDEKETNSSFLPDAPDAGAVAPALEATTLDGAPLALKDFAGKYVLLDFWATWRGPCLAEIPNLQDIHGAFGKDERFAILSLSIDETIDAPRKFQETRKLPWNQGFLKGEFDGPKAYGVQAIPAFVLVGPDGKIVARGMRGEEIKKAVAKALGKAE